MNSSTSISSSSTIHYHHPKNKIKFTPFSANTSFDDDDDETNKGNNSNNNSNKTVIINNNKSPISNKTISIEQYHNNNNGNNNNNNNNSNKLNFSNGGDDDDDYQNSKNSNNVEYHLNEEEYNEEEELLEFDKSSSSSTSSLSTIDIQTTPNGNNSNNISSTTTVSSGESSRLSFTITFTISLIIIFACIFYFSKNLVSFLEFVKELGLLGNVILGAAFLPTGIPLAIFSIYIPLTLSAGFIYGFVPGFITVAIGSAISASFGFWTTRKVSLKWFESKIESSPKLSSLRNRVEQHPFKIIIIMRLLPIPFGLQNGLCAMTRISYTKFIYSSVIGLTFENILLSYLGSSIKSITDITNGHQNAFSSYQQTLIVIAIVVAIILTCVCKKILSNSIRAPIIPISISPTDSNNINNNNNQKSNDTVLIISPTNTQTSSSTPLNDVISTTSKENSSNNNNNNININSPFSKNIHKTRKD